jgi:hypothetical protein
MKKNILISILLFTLISCKKEENANIKNVYYKTISEESRILDYRLKSYHFIGDTILEKEIILTKDKKFYFNKNSFLKSNGDLFIVKKNKNSVIIEPYLTVQKLDSCNIIKHPFGDYKICYEGKEDFLSYKNCYKLDYSSIGIDGLSMTVFLDPDFTTIAQVARLATFSEVIKIDISEVPKDFRKELQRKL